MNTAAKSHGDSSKRSLSYGKNLARQTMQSKGVGVEVGVEGLLVGKDHRSRRRRREGGRQYGSLWSVWEEVRKGEGRGNKGKGNFEPRLGRSEERKGKVTQQPTARSRDEAWVRKCRGVLALIPKKRQRKAIGPSSQISRRTILPPPHDPEGGCSGVGSSAPLVSLKRAPGLDAVPLQFPWPSRRPLLLSPFNPPRNIRCPDAGGCISTAAALHFPDYSRSSYNLSTPLTLLQEVYEVADTDVKIDWHALVKKTATGITNAREYQMLWRHLAYRHPLLDKIEEGAEPLDDDSDLEIELEIVPPVIDEAVRQATECVQLLFSSCGLGSTKKTGLKAPLVEKGVDKEILDAAPGKQPPQTSHGVAVSTLLKKQTENELLGSSYPPKKKRKLWTKEEDKELIAAVRKFGEGNWANILRENLKLDRTPSQLSQRWSIIRKRDANILAVSGNKSVSSAQSEERIAAQKAIILALDTPKGGRLSGGAQSIGRTSSSPLVGSVPEALAVSSQPFNQHKPPVPAASQALDSRFPYKCGTTSTKSTTHFATNSSIQAAAFAAGGRIATPSTAASLFRAAQSKTAVHIGPCSSSVPSSSNLIKSFAVTSTAAMASKSMPTVGTTAPSLANPVSSSYNTKPGGQQVQGCSVEVVKNLQNAGSDTIPQDLLGKEVECADDSELYKLLELDMDLAIENDVGNANDASESVAPKSHAAKELLTENADSKVVSSVSETENLKSG
ncbi:uncharacterized protein LOC122053453 [Zingiber officinale]|uniref:uncharacterized protein LOC122053453 n=1 Tax=Zingiber officinale TaxID=94328 RepID=UPI001C4B5CD0|nr:uncharacterized protein LOC122053453 [Zingiber officinale]